MTDKLTFKRGPKETGLARIGNPYPWTTIKLNGRAVGSILPPSTGASLNPDPNWRIQLHQIDSTSNCGWSNRMLKARFDDEPSARAFILRNAEKIIAKGLYQLEK